MGNQPLPEEIMSAEFQYIAQTAAQANEDRAAVTSFYLVAAGSLILAILSAQRQNFDQPIYWALTAVFAVLSVAGLLTLLQLIRLRQAWFESIYAMNVMKDYVVERYQDQNLAEAFAWRSKTIPAKYKPWSVHFLLALQVSFLSSITLGAAVMFGGRASNQWWWGAATMVGTAFLLVQMLIYRWALRR